MDEAVTLVVAPFRDIVDKAKAALENAANNDDMRKAAQNLSREGERALKRIEPLCNKQFAEYSSSFIIALKENDSIAKFRSELNDLLWEFDDYTELDEFDLAKFDELRATSRKAAPAIIDIITRMKLVPPPPSTPLPPSPPTPGVFMALSPPISPQQGVTLPADSSPMLAMPPPLPPPTAPLPPLPISVPPKSKRRSIMPSSMALAGLPKFHEGHAQLSKGPRSPLLTPESHLDQRQAQSSPALRPMRAMPPPQAPPPAPPSSAPWDPRDRGAGDAAELSDDTKVTRRPHVPAAESPVQPPISTFYDTGKRAASSDSQTLESHGLSNGPLSENDERRRNIAPTYGIFPVPPMTRPRTSTKAPVIPEENIAGPFPLGPSRNSVAQYPYSPSSYALQSRQRSSSVLSVNSDLNDSSSHSQDARSSTATGVDSSRLSSTTKSSHRKSRSVGGVEAFTPIAISEDSYGPIPVESETASVSTRPGTNRTSMPPAYAVNSRDCTITNNSSFYLAGGFCEGAREVVRGGSGIKKTKKPVGFTTSTSIARCTDCMFELNMADIETDSKRDDKGNFLKCGINFRIRFLQKCHLATKRNDDVLYGCPICIANGRTIDDSDATVFFNVKTLFTHLNWHSRPLPEIPGFTIIDTAEVPTEHHNNYDLHFPSPPVPHPALEADTNLSLSPTGIAREPIRKLVGQRLLPDRTPALELATGAKVTGLTWPEQYNGEWCLGWHDGIHASVPTESLTLQPPSHEVKMGGLSNIRAKVRWRFHPSSKDKGDWLSLSKGDTITNINWAYIDHWCWSGTNSKGKWGMFPQVFLDTNTMEENSSAGSDPMSVVSDEKKGGIFSRFSSRNKPATPKRPSVGGSNMSHETTTGALASAFIYPAIGER
jgi:hypothetical protein